MRYLNGYERTQQMMGIGFLGEIRQGPDGNLYEWVQGVDGLGNPIGFWKKLKKWGKRLAKTALKYHPTGWALRKASPFLRRALPIVQRVASAIPIPQAQAVAAGLRTTAPLLRRAGVAGYGGLGVLYEAPDGGLYQVQGWGEADDLRGFAEDDLRGFDEADDLRGFAEDDLRGLGALYQAPDGTLYRMQGLDEADDLRGFAEDDLRGFDETDDLRGFAEDELRGFAEDDLRGFDEADDLRGFAEDDLRGLEAYVSDRPAGTRWFVPPAQPPEIWRPLW